MSKSYTETELIVMGWEACRRSLWVVCEDVQSQGEDHRSDIENEPRHHFGRGYLTAGKSIARGFGAMNALDDDNVQSILQKLEEERTAK
jgi:hypothetical protein